MTSKRNVLVTSAGRRVELVRAFSREVECRGLTSSVFATDLRPQMSAACHVADRAFPMTRVTSPSYSDELLALCEDHAIGMVIPTIDTELTILSAARSRFEEAGVSVIVSDQSLVKACRDKRITAALFSSLGIDIPAILERDQLAFPCFAKPYDGSRSVGATKLKSPSDFTAAMRDDRKLMFLEFIDESFDEYTVDAYYNRNGKLTCLIPRQRLEVREGEVSKGVTRRGYVYEYLMGKLERLVGARGCLTVQLFAKPDGRRFAAIEINPRFGGGYPLSYAAGANFPGWLLDEYFLGREVSFFEGWEPDLLMLRYDAQVLVSDAR